MDWFWVLVFGGLSFWFHRRFQQLEQRVASLSAANEKLRRDPAEGSAQGEPAAKSDARSDNTVITRPAAEAPPEMASQKQASDPAPQPEHTVSPPAGATGPAADARAKTGAPLWDAIAQFWPKRPAIAGKIGKATGDDPSSDAATPPTQAPSARRSSFDFEDIFGRLLPIWGGGIALAIAGFFLVRWSIENGLLNEYVRVALGFVFGLGLIGAAEIAHRFSDKLADERVRQALCGAGIATLYASFYLAGAQYNLIGPVAAFGGLALVTLLAALLSFRFGLPGAVLGLVGGFATPALAGGSDPNLPVLATYLALVTGGLAYTGQRQKRPWLSVAALAGGLGWGAVMLVIGAPGDGSILALGGYLVMVGTLLPALLGQSRLGTLGKIAAATLAVVQIAALVTTNGYSLLAWGTYLLIAAALAGMGWRNHRLREASAIAAGLAVCLLAAWPSPDIWWFWAITLATTALFALLPLTHIWRDNACHADWGKLIVFPPLLAGAVSFQRGVLPVADSDPVLAGFSIALAAFPACGAWLRWRAEEGVAMALETRCSMLSALGLVWLGGMLITPAWSAPAVHAGIAAVAFALTFKDHGRLSMATRWAFALAAVPLLLATGLAGEFSQLVYDNPSHPRWRSALRWSACALPFVLIAWKGSRGGAQRVAETAACLLGYGAATMLIPAMWMPLALLCAVILAAWCLGARATLMGVLLALSGAWASLPLSVWTARGFAALVAEPMLASDLPEARDLVLYIAPLLAALVAAIALQTRLISLALRIYGAIAAGLALMLVHTAYKGLFNITDLDTFVRFGLAERTLWQGLLAIAGVALVYLGRNRTQWIRNAGKQAGTALVGTALAHFMIFGMIWHNPLLSLQATGPWPLFNLLPVSYGIAIAGLIWLRGASGHRFIKARPWFDAAIMGTISVLCLSLLRHSFAGTILLDPAVGAGEDLLRSLLALLLALAFLGWGARKQQRSWRIGSLVLALLAVGKVFLFDTAGLEGLARIGSFLALGLSLIAIGWFYAKQLAAPGQAQQEQAR